MTKIKNTKKGMAKKTLSVSLAVAMLATSNVPVWAAEFSDGTEAAFTSEVEAPVVEDNTEDTTVATAIDGIYEAKVELSATEVEWGSNAVTATVNVKDKTTGNIVTTTDGIKAVWKNKDGEQVPGTSVVSITSANQVINVPTASLNDFKNGESYYLYLYSTLDTTFEATSGVVKVVAKDITDDNITIKLDGVASGTDFTENYTGKNIKPTVTFDNNTENISFVVNYDGDLVNVGTVTVKAKANTEGYTGTLSRTYEITPTALTSSNIGNFVTASMVTKDFVYAGTAGITVKKSDVSLVDKNTGVDLSALIASDSAVTTTAKNATTTANQYATLALTQNASVKNFTITGSVNVNTVDRFSVSKLDLSGVTATIQPMEAGTTINEATIKSNTTFSYNGTGITFAANDVKIEGIPTNTSEVGSHTLTVKYGTSNNTVNSTTATLSLVAHDISAAKFYNSANTQVTLPEATYTGSEIKPDIKSYKVKLSDTGVALKEGTDYTVSYTNNVNAGTGYVVLTGAGSYEGSIAKIPFTINQAKVSSITKVALVAYNPAYTTADQYASEINLVVKAGNIILEEGKDYTVTYAFADTAAGNKSGASVVITINYSGNFNQNGRTPGNVTIGKKAIKDADIVMEKTVYEYTGAAIKPEFKVMDGTTELKEGTDYKIDYTKNLTSVGKAYLTVIGQGSYDSRFSATAEFEIVAAKADNLVVTASTSTYDGTQKKPTVTIKLNGNVLSTSDFDIAYGENINAGKEAGTVTVTPKAANKNIEGTKTATFEIQKATLSGGTLTAYNERNLIETISSKTFNYDGTAHEFAKVKYTAPTGLGSKKVTDADYEIVYVDNVYGKAVSTVQKGAILVLATEAGNYKNTTTYTDAAGKVYNNVIKYEQFTITPASFTQKEITVSNAEYAEGLVVKPTVVVKDGSKVLEEGKDYELVLTGASAAATEVTKTNTLVVEVKGINGYAGSDFTGLAWGVDRKDLKNTDITAKLTADNKVEVTVMNGKIKVNKTEYTVSELANGKVTVTAAKDSKHYTGSVEVEIPQKFPVGKAMIENVDVTGNTVAVKLAGEVENLVGDGDVGYDYVISKSSDCLNRVDRVAVNKTLPTTDTTFYYLEPGTYYAYCHAWTRDEDGMKAFGEWSNVVEFKVTAVTPAKPQITSVKISGSTVTVTYTESEGAEGYDIVLGSTLGTDAAGYKRPYDYGKLVKKNVKAGTTTVTFKNVESGTYYVGLHAWSKEDGKKVFSKWSNIVTRTVK